MKRILCVLSVLAFCSGVAMADGLLSFGVQATGGSISAPGHDQDAYSSGFGGGAHIDLNLPIILSLRFSGDYVVFSPDADKYKQLLAADVPGSVASDFTLDGGSIKVLAFSLNGKLAMPTPVLSPYLTGGIGTASFSGEDATVTFNGAVRPPTWNRSAKTATSVNIGAGVDWKLILTLYLEARYTVAFTSNGNSSFALASLGITF